MTSRLIVIENATPEGVFEPDTKDLVFYGAHGIIFKMKMEIAISLEALLNELAALIPEGITYPFTREEE